MFSVTLGANCAFGSKYGQVVIEYPNGKKLFLRREARGLNYDQLSLSDSANYCTQPDPSKALIFNTLGSGAYPVFYKFENGELRLFSSLTEGRDSFPNGAKVVPHEEDNPRLSAWRENEKYKPVDIKKIEVPINESLWCFGIENLSRFHKEAPTLSAILSGNS